MKTFSRLAVVSSLCLCLASAQTYQPSAAAVKSVDAQAFAYTGKHCTSKFTARAPRQMPQDDFATVVSITDTFVRAAAKKDPTTKLKTNKVSDTLYLFAADSREKGVPRSEFGVFFYDQGLAYAYTCDLK